MIKGLIQEILGEETAEEANLDERNKENKAMKDKVATQAGADQYSSRFLAKNQPALNTLKQQGRDVQKGMGTGTVPNSPNNRRDMKTMMSDPLQRRAAGAQMGRNKPGDALNVKMGTGTQSSTNSAVPQDVQGKVKQGGKVVFGKYFDSAGTFLGSVKQGKWVPAASGQQAGTLEENKTGMIRLTQLLNENMAARRINLVRVQTIMEKLYPELTDSQSKKLMELCTEVHMMASQLNMTPYIRTESSLMEWTLLVAGFKTKIHELKEEVVKVCEEKKIDPTTAVKALDEVLAY